MRYNTKSPFFTGITSLISSELFATPDLPEKTFKATWLAVSTETCLADRVLEKRREEKRRENNSFVNCIE